MAGKGEVREISAHRLGEAAGSPAALAVPKAMNFRITVESRYLRGDLYFRRTAAETREFLDAVSAESIRHQRWRILVSVHASRPIFTVEKYGLSSFLDLAERYAEKIALHADAIELHIAHDYAAMLARVRGINVRTFRSEATAIAWLSDRRHRSERRQHATGHVALERRRVQNRRVHQASRER